MKGLGECAVHECTNPATGLFRLNDGQPVAMICDAHGNLEHERGGWILRTGVDQQPTLYPPGTNVPPF